MPQEQPKKKKKKKKIKRKEKKEILSVGKDVEQVELLYTTVGS